MIGIIVVTHGNLAKELISAVKFVLGEDTDIKMKEVCIDQSREFETLSESILSAIKEVNNGAGILIVTDMFGGTPSNISLTFLEKGKLEVVTGVNLPMLLKLATLKEDISLEEAVRIAEKAGKENIIVASKLLSKDS